MDGLFPKVFFSSVYPFGELFGCWTRLPLFVDRLSRVVPLWVDCFCGHPISLFSSLILFLFLAHFLSYCHYSVSRFLCFSFYRSLFLSLFHVSFIFLYPHLSTCVYLFFPIFPYLFDFVLFSLALFWVIFVVLLSFVFLSLLLSLSLFFSFLWICTCMDDHLLIIFITFYKFKLDDSSLRSAS